MKTKHFPILLILALSVACSNKSQAIKPLTEYEKLTYRNDVALLSSAQQEAQNAKATLKAVALQKALEQSMVYADLQKAQKAYADSPEVKAAQQAGEEASNTPEAKNFNKLNIQYQVHLGAIFDSRNLNKQTHGICDGPQKGNPICVGVSDGELEIRSTVPAAPKK